MNGNVIKQVMITAMLALAGALQAGAIVVDATGQGDNKKFTTSISVSHPMFAKCLQRNLELSGLFAVGATGSIKVSGAPGGIRAEGAGKSLSCGIAFSDDAAARMAAREFANAMCQAYGNQKGFALDRLLFLNRGKQSGKNTAVPGEICVGYADGYDCRRLTSDAKMAVFPRWMKDGESILYISDLKGAPQIWEMNTRTGRRHTRWSFKGTPTAIAVSPDGSKVAAVLSFQGNPELYILQGDRYIRLTNTTLASEGQPTWSPDGRQIAYVSNETRYPQIYVIDVATKQKRRLTSRGTQNVDPDWSPDGRSIAYITKRGGSQVAVMDAAAGDATARLVTSVSNWEHPSWSRDSRHVVANRDRALFVVDTIEGADAPRQIPLANGDWNSACWMK